MFRWLVSCLLACFVTGCSSVPLVYESVNAPSTNTGCSNPYFIRTRVVVEMVDNKPVRNIDKVFRDLRYAEAIYDDLPIWFVVIDFATSQADQDWDAYLDSDADRHPECLNIYYVHGRSSGDSKTIGKGSFPWLAHSNGIVIYAPCDSKDTLAHEIGHYFGLMHTFEMNGSKYDDCVDDTLDPKQFADNTPDVDYRNYNNIMNYHWWQTNFATAGQIGRMRWFLTTTRKGVLMEDAFGLGKCEPQMPVEPAPIPSDDLPFSIPAQGR